MEITPANDNRQCRLCLNYIERLLYIFDQAARDKNVASLLQTHLHIQVDEEKPLPKHICLNCLETVEAFDKFYTDVAQNQTFLAQNEKTTVSVLVWNEEHLEQDESVEHHDKEEEVIEEPVDPKDSFMLHCVSEEGPCLVPEMSRSRSNPPSYDEVQQTKRAKLIDTGTTTHVVGSNVAADRHYIEPGVEEPCPSNGLKVIVGTFANSDDVANGSELETDVQCIQERTVQSAGIVVKVCNIKYPRMIRDGKLVVKGEVLDKCIGKFYGLECELCNEKSSTMEELFTHYRNVHNDEGYVMCCGRKIAKRVLMAMHMARHLEPEAFECPHCKKMMTSPRILRFHIRNHLPEEQRPLKCDLCPRRFSYVSGLLTHASTHQTENKSNQAFHICDECGRAYRTRGRLTEHILTSHAGDGSTNCARCDICGKKFSSKSTLSYHMTTHEPNVHQEQCEHCGKWLKNKICLRKHMLQHSGFLYHCDKCDYSTTNSQRMQSHLRVQHTDAKPYECPECGKAFKLRYNLRNHMAQHTGERKFTCEFCSRQFASSSNYYSHRKRMHSEEMELKRKQKELMDSEIRIKLKKV
ncbi:transcription factor grauzone-like [Anopheles ziemanni]|uniref:transcription factor grauzone-like n=1 Tax=Anopheles coustani TaxID=139045 RepID=UPI0026585A5E|nr:transcription factor grauzone-like [Anopheles coustani]XP_058170166.1 transcription factor grauzone-like [Anopheles ziemanni]